ncbi:MAG: (Fe-S)-binding protein [Candidatus Aenigmatarchaeota archaeon]
MDMKKLFDKLRGGNILYYPGCLTKFVVKELGENYRKILRNIGIDFIELKDLEVCCGSPALNAGYKKDAKNLAEKNFKTFKEHSIRKIITSCPACYKVFSQDYPRLLKEWDIDVEHTIQTIARALKEGKLKLKKKFNGLITYHDPCHLGRYSKIYKEPREILKFLGFKISEMEFSMENSFCCGGGGGVVGNYPELANEIAKERIKQAKKTKAKILITACPLCYVHLKKFATGIEVKEISEFLF